MDRNPEPASSAAVYWIVLTLAFYATLGLSCLCFWLNPSAFYFRAWEYFSDIVNRTARVAPVWEGYERGDLSRRNLFFHQEKHLTRVTTDQDGFRSTPPMPGPYQIVVLGDSAIFGSGLSDEETLPWRLAQKLDLGVFNGARQNISQVLGREGLRSARLVIEGRTERALVHNLREGDQPQLAYLPLRQEKMKLLDCAPLQLYFFPSMADRVLGRLGNDVQDILSHCSALSLQFVSHRHAYKPRLLSEALAAARRRQAALSRLGYTYLLLPIPAFQTIYATDVDDFTRSFIPRLCQELEKEGLPCLDLTAIFSNHKSEGLWQESDTHWNGRATELAAEELAGYLRKRDLASRVGLAP